MHTKASRKSHTCADKEALKVLVSKPASRGATKTGGETLSAICGLDLNAERAQDIDSPGSARAAVLRPLGHRSGDVAVDEPVATFDLMRKLVFAQVVSFILRQCYILLGIPYIVVITAGADTIDDEGADLLDAGKLGTTHDDVWKNGKRHEKGSSMQNFQLK